jgi:type VI secretion system protein ImpF
MAGPRSHDVLRHSVFDRLADTGGRAGGDLRIGVEDLKKAVLRDVERLLNCKSTMHPDVAELPELSTSILAYGLPDFSHFSGASGADRQRICDLITRALRTFEPRLEPRSIKVDFIERDDVVGLHNNFRIRALLHVDPVRESIRFDTTIEMDTGAVEVRMVEG